MMYRSTLLQQTNINTTPEWVVGFMLRDVQIVDNTVRIAKPRERAACWESMGGYWIPCSADIGEQEIGRLGWVSMRQGPTGLPCIPLLDAQDRAEPIINQLACDSLVIIETLMQCTCYVYAKPIAATRASTDSHDQGSDFYRQHPIHDLLENHVANEACGVC